MNILVYQLLANSSIHTLRLSENMNDFKSGTLSISLGCSRSLLLVLCHIEKEPSARSAQSNMRLVATLLELFHGTRKIVPLCTSEI